MGKKTLAKMIRENRPSRNGSVRRDTQPSQGAPASNGMHAPPHLGAAAESIITPVLRTLATVQLQPVRWMWHRYVPRGAVTILDGDPGLGKSTITLDLAARVSRGWEMPPASGPCQRAEPADVLILSAEDDAGSVIRPRLEAAGADLERVNILDGIRTAAHVALDGTEVPESERPPILPRDVDHLDVIVRKHGVVLVVIDPIMAYLDAETDAHRDQDVRLVLYRLSRLAGTTGSAIVLVRHLSKHRSTDAIYRGGGSIGIIGAARSGLLVARHPEIPDTCVLAGTKSNLGPMPPALAYQMVPTGDVARIGWGDAVEITADELVEPRRGGSSAVAQAKERKNKEDDGAALTAVDRLTERAARKQSGRYPTKTEIKAELGWHTDRLTRTLGRLEDEGLLREVPITFATGTGRKVNKPGTGYRRLSATEREEWVSRSVSQSLD